MVCYGGRPPGASGTTVEVGPEMDELDELLATARTAYARGDWHAAHRQLTRARTLSELSTGDLNILGSSAWWLGQAKESLEISEQVYHRLEDDDDASGAAM